MPDEITANMVIERFKRDCMSTLPHGGLAALHKNGWSENCPSENCWHFDHPDFPGWSVDWSFDDDGDENVQVYNFNH